MFHHAEWYVVTDVPEHSDYVFRVTVQAAFEGGGTMYVAVC
jgi:hypothetical protein